MANTNYVQLPPVVGLDGSEVVSLVQPGTSNGTDKKATTRQLMATALPNLSAGPTPSTGFLVPLVKVSDGLAYSVSVSTFMTALHGVPAGGTTGQLLGKVSNADYDITWVSAGTVFSVGLSMPAVFTVANSPITSSGTLAVSANGTSGGIPYFNASTTMASSGVLAANQIMLGGGAATTPATLGTLGTTATVLHGNAAGPPTFAAVSLTVDVTGTLPVANGGTGLTSITAHNLLIGNGTGAAVLLAPNATSGIPLVSQGAGSDPAYAMAVVAGGGTGLASATAYAVICGGTTSTGAFQSIAGVGTSGQLLTSNGAGALPTFQTASSAIGQAFTKTDDTNVTATLGGAPTTAVLSAMSFTLGWTGQLGLTRGGTAASLTADNGGIVYSSASALAIVASTATAGQVIRSGASAAPTWSTATYPATTTINQLLYSSSANVIAGVATGNNGVLVTSSGGVPSISSTIPNATQINITALGTIATGVWNGTVVGAQYGGTGAATLTASAVILGNGTGAVAFATIGTAGRLLIDQGAASNPAFTAMSGDATIAASGAITFGANVVSYTKFQQAAGLTLLGVTGSSTANYGALTGTANQLPFVNSGATALAFGSLSTLLDNTLSSTQGAVIYRGAATWSALGPGSSGQFLQTQGAALNPQWAAAAGGGSVTAVTASAQGLTVNGVGGAAGGSFNVSGTLTPIETINAQTGTTYTVLSTDHTKLVTFSNAASIAVTLPQANGAGFNAGFWWECQNIGVGTVTITPTTSTVDGAATIVLATGQGVRIISDGTNYNTQRGRGITSVTPGGGLTTTLTATAPGSAITTSGTVSSARLVNAQTGTSYAILDGDRAKLITTVNASAQAYSLAQAGAASAFQSGWFCDLQNNSTAAAGIVTITPTTSTINGASTLKVQPGLWVRIVSDGTNYQVFALANSKQLPATATNDDANAGNIGELITTATTASSNANATVTMTIASPCVVTWTGHGFSTQAVTTAVKFTTSGALPTGVTSGTTYYLKAIDANTFNIATTVDNALAGTFINTSGSQSGTQTGDIRVSVTTLTSGDLAGMSLTAGDWDVSGSVLFGAAASTTVIALTASWGTTSATISRTVGRFLGLVLSGTGVVVGASDFNVLNFTTSRISLSATTTIYLVQNASFGTSTMQAAGWAKARRVR